MISKKIEDFKIYVEDDNKNYISSFYVGSCEQTIGKRIMFNINIGKDFKFELSLTREEVKTLTNLLNEVNKHL